MMQQCQRCAVLPARAVSAFCFCVIVAITGFPCSAQAKAKAVVFTQIAEPREKAFTLLVPRGWTLEGGAIRILDERHGGALNMAECKFDIAVKSDKQGSAMLRWFPEMICIDTSQAWGNPEGAIFNNALVRTKRDPVRFLLEVAVPYAHPGVRNVTVLERKNLPALASVYAASAPRELAFFTNMQYYAALVTVTYDENGVRYKERLLTVIEDFGPGGGGLWKNRLTMLARAPEAKYAAYESIFGVIQNSGQWNPAWVVGELRGQMQRQGTIAMTQKDLQRIEQEITDSRRKTQESIQRDMYLTVTGQDDYVNPFTGKVERDTAAWQRRWVNESGNVIYTDDASYDPNRDPELKVTGYKLSKGK